MPRKGTSFQGIFVSQAIHHRILFCFILAERMVERYLLRILWVFLVFGWYTCVVGVCERVV